MVCIIAKHDFSIPTGDHQQTAASWNRLERGLEEAVMEAWWKLAQRKFSWLALPRIFFYPRTPSSWGKKSRAPRKSELQFVSHKIAYQTLVDGSNDGLLHNFWIASRWLSRCPCDRSAPDADALKHHSIFGVCRSDVVKNEIRNGVDIGMKIETRCAQRIQKSEWKTVRRTM